MAYVKVADRGLSVEETNGSGKLTRLALQKKLDYYEKAAEACRFILAQFDDARPATTLDAALHIEKVRHTQRAPKSATGHAAYLHRKATREVRRKETDRVLRKFSKTEPRSGKGSGRGTGALLRNGYIKKTADGLFLRTDKVFTV